MKKLFTFAVLLLCLSAKAQTLSLSDEISITGVDGYGIIGKYNDRTLLFLLNNNGVKLRAFDSQLHKLWERDLELEHKNSAKVLEVIGSKQDFSIIYQYRKKNHNYIKVQKYDGQAKLLDSLTIFDWGKALVAPNLELRYSEDKKSALAYEIIEAHQLKLLAFNLDSLRPIWDKTIDLSEGGWYKAERFEQIVFNNQAEFYAITEEDNRTGSEKHRFEVTKYTKENGVKKFALPVKDMVCLDVKFSFDNVNHQLVAAGLYSAKNFVRAKGYFFARLPPQYEGGGSFDLTTQVFDDELATALLGKKVTDNKGIEYLKVQDIVHRRDGGILAVIEQFRTVERRSAPTTTTARYGGFSSNSGYAGMSVDYYLENVFALSIAPDGKSLWRSIFYKKQYSQDDEARYSSFFLAKTPSSLRFLFNDEIERATTVSEFVLNGSGEGERHVVMNTQGQDLYLRFRDALQVAANEIVVPSDDKRRIRLVKIQY